MAGSQGEPDSRHQEMSLTNIPHTPSLTSAQRAEMEAGALSYDDYVEVAKVDEHFLRENYRAVDFTPDETMAIDALDGPLTLFAIVEERCSDVIANLPIVARIAERNPALALHILYRPDHRDIANAYAGPSRRSLIPTYILFDGRCHELGVLIERPAVITVLTQDFAAITRAEIAKRFPGMPPEQLPADFVAERLGQAMALRNAGRGLERAEIVRWLLDSAARAR
jgi:hypothetical protein